MKHIQLFRLLFALLFAATCFQGLHAQARHDGPNLHLGLGLLGNIAPSGVGNQIPPVGVSVDFPFKEQFSLGGYIGYTGYKQPIFGDVSAKYSVVILGARGAYHHDFEIDKLDAYGGLMLGYNIFNSKLTGNTTFPYEASASGVGYSFFVGANYAFTEKIGAFAELGYGIALVQLGLNLNL